MKAPLRIGLTLVAALPCLMSRDATAQESQEPLSAYEAKFHVGEHATVCGRVESGVYLRHSFRQPTYLNLDGEYPNHLFTIFIRREDRSQFPMPPERQYAAQHVCVTGVIEMMSLRDSFNVLRFDIRKNCSRNGPLSSILWSWRCR
jgi:hypothetical protein